MKHIFFVAFASVLTVTACQPVQSTQKSSSVASEKAAAANVEAKPGVEKGAVSAAQKARLADRVTFIDEYAADGKPTLSKAEFDAARATRLKEMDSNKNGVVDTQEYADEYATRLEKKISAERKAQVDQTVIRFGAVDKNRDGKITLDEFQASGARIFDFLDKQKTGVIAANTAESTAASTSRSVLAMPDTHSVKGFLEIYDVDGDNKVTRVEFEQHRKAQFEATDANRDGYVNTEEYLLEFENRLDRQIKQARESQVKQAHVRFKSLDTNKDLALSLQEFNTSGDRIFTGWDVNGDGIVDVTDPLPEPKPRAQKPDEQGDKKSQDASTAEKVKTEKPASSKAY